MAHREIKTYTIEQSASVPSEFALKDMAEIYRSSQGASDRPHRHDYYTIIFIEKGSGTHYVDFCEYEVKDNQLYFILPGQMHQMVLSAEPKGWVLIFTEAFLVSNAINEKLIQDIYLFNDYGQSPPLSVSDVQLPVYKSIIDQMLHFSTEMEKYSSDANGSLLKLFLIQSNNHCSLHRDENPQLVESSNNLLRSFKHLLNSHYAAWHKVSDYADKLSVTADYLNKSVKGITGKSAKEHIQSKILIEAKRNLQFSVLSSKELSYQLGFEESAHFNNFFKKMTGITPSEFRLTAQMS